MTNTKSPWKTISSESKYRNPWINVREDQVITPGGKPGIYGVVEAKVATGVLALTEDNELYLVGQYRYPLSVYSWEIVEGGAELDEEPLAAIKRELKEEAGLEAASWRQLGGVIHLSNCYTNECGYLYVAQDLKEVSRKPDDTEELAVKKLPFSEVFRMVMAGEITDSLSIIGILRLQHELATVK